jgi:hypothetical protein
VDGLCLSIGRTAITSKSREVGPAQPAGLHSFTTDVPVFQNLPLQGLKFHKMMVFPVGAYSTEAGQSMAVLPGHLLWAAKKVSCQEPGSLVTHVHCRPG